MACPEIRPSTRWPQYEKPLPTRRRKRAACVWYPWISRRLDRISHAYIRTILQSYGLRGIRRTHSKDIRKCHIGLQVNGHISDPIPIQCGVRQGCPLSMIFLTLCLNPLINYLDERLQGLRARGRQKKTAVIAYTDFVPFLVTSHADVQKINEAIPCYEKATSDVRNVAKSHAFAVGTWDTSCDVMGISYSEEITILGVKLRNTANKSALASWTRLTSLVRTQAYSRDLNIAQRIAYVQVYMLAKLWYTAQVLQPPSECLRQIVCVISWYIWQGAFRVPLSVLQRGLGLTEVDTKWRALLITRIWFQGQREGTVMAGWQHYWKLHGMRDNPPTYGLFP